MKLIILLLLAVSFAADASAAYQARCELDAHYRAAARNGIEDVITVAGRTAIYSSVDAQGRLVAPVIPRRIKWVDPGTCQFAASQFGLDDSTPGQGFRVDGKALWVMGGRTFYAER